MLRHLVLLALVLGLAVGVAGCGGSGGSKASEGTTSSTQTTTGGDDNDCVPIGEAGLTPRMSPALQNRKMMYLTDVSIDSKDECRQQVVFDFEKQAPGPGFEVSYKPASAAKIEDGSGKPIAVDGVAFLVVRLYPAMTAKIDGDKVTKTYTGPNRIKSEDSFVREVVKTGDFEGYVTWAIGLDQKRAFTTKASESQLVVELAGTS